MAFKKQPDSGASELPEAAHDWFRQFLKHLQLFMVETSQSLRPDSDSVDHRPAAMRALKLTLLESGMNHEEVRNFFGLVAIKSIGITMRRTCDRILDDLREVCRPGGVVCRSLEGAITYRGLRWSARSCCRESRVCTWRSPLRASHGRCLAFRLVTCTLVHAHRHPTKTKRKRLSDREARRCPTIRCPRHYHFATVAAHSLPASDPRRPRTHRIASFEFAIRLR